MTGKAEVGAGLRAEFGILLARRVCTDGKSFKFKKGEESEPVVVSSSEKRSAQFDRI